VQSQFCGFASAVTDRCATVNRWRCRDPRFAATQNPKSWPLRLHEAACIRDKGDNDEGTNMRQYVVLSFADFFGS